MQGREEAAAVTWEREGAAVAAQESEPTTAGERGGVKVGREIVRRGGG